MMIRFATTEDRQCRHLGNMTRQHGGVACSFRPYLICDIVPPTTDKISKIVPRIRSAPRIHNGIGSHPGANRAADDVVEPVPRKRECPKTHQEINSTSSAKRLPSSSDGIHKVLRDRMVDQRSVAVDKIASVLRTQLSRGDLPENYHPSHAEF
jgi:hypothetical protein